MAPLATTEAINNNSRNEQSLHVFFQRDEKSAVATLSTAHQTNSTNNLKKTHRFRWSLHVDNLLECLPQSCNQHRVTELVTLIPEIAMIVYANEISLELFKLKVS